MHIHVLTLVRLMAIDARLAPITEKPVETATNSHTDICGEIQLKSSPPTQHVSRPFVDFGYVIRTKGLSGALIITVTITPVDLRPLLTVMNNLNEIKTTMFPSEN